MLYESAVVDNPYKIQPTVHSMHSPYKEANKQQSATQNASYFLSCNVDLFKWAQRLWRSFHRTVFSLAAISVYCVLIVATYSSALHRMTFKLQKFIGYYNYSCLLFIYQLHHMYQLNRTLFTLCSLLITFNHSLAVLPPQTHCWTRDKVRL